MAHHQHQASLEHILGFDPPPSLSAEQRYHASRRFYQIVRYFDNDAEAAAVRAGSYNRPRLIRLTYEYARSDESRDLLLQSFFQPLGLSLGTEEDITFGEREEELMRSGMAGFAEYLMDNLYLPLKAATHKTPQPSPAYHSAVLMVQGSSQGYATTPTRISALRGTSLVRDHHRCVISRSFDFQEAQKRRKSEGRANAKDDDGIPLSGDLDYLEVAHIVPHSLMRPQEGSESRKAALAILNMFDVGVSRLIEGVEIDRPFNALTLSLGYRRQFGEFRTFFTELADQGPHTYRIESFDDDTFRGGVSLPVTRTLLPSPDRNIDPPSSRLLAVHRAVAHVLHLSGAGDYTDQFLSDVDDGYVRSDGATQLDRLVRLRLGGTSRSEIGVS